MTSSYLDHLPALFRDEEFLGRFLLAFETMLSGRGERVGLESEIGRVADYLDPMTADPEFLPWLSDWVAADPAGRLARGDQAQLPGPDRPAVPAARHRGGTPAHARAVHR